VRRGPILTQAVDAVNASSRPMRWRAKDYIFADNPGAVQGFNTDQGVVFIEKALVLSELIREHPKSKAAADAQVSKGAYVIFPNRDAQGVFFWAFPQFARLLTTLRSDEAGLNGFIAAARFLGRRPPAAQLPSAG